MLFRVLVSATHVGVEGFDPVHQSLILQKLQGTVDGHWGCTLNEGFDLLEKIIGLRGLMALPDEL